jgi:hypothetical protein
VALWHATGAWPNLANLIGFAAISPGQLNAAIGNPEDAFGDDEGGGLMGTFFGCGS